MLHRWWIRRFGSFGRIDVVVNNAGLFEGGTVADATTEHWRKVLATNLDAAFFVSRAAIPHFLKTRGAIVNTSSVSGLGGEWGAAAYVAAKGALSNLTRAMALDLARDGVRVNAVCPTMTATPMTGRMASQPEMMAKFRDRIPLGRAAIRRRSLPPSRSSRARMQALLPASTFPLTGALPPRTASPHRSAIKPSAAPQRPEPGERDLRFAAYTTSATARPEPRARDHAGNAASSRSTTTMSCPASLRYNAVATLTAPALSTTTGMVTPPSCRHARCEVGGFSDRASEFPPTPQATLPLRVVVRFARALLAPALVAPAALFHRFCFSRSIRAATSRAISRSITSDSRFDS